MPYFRQKPASTTQQPSTDMATNTLKPISSAAIRQRMEELQARRREFMKRNPPQWISKQKIIQHVLGAEMVSLSRESDFAKLPAEMQLSVISFMDYPSVLKLKQTCRYFNFFINADVLRDSKQYQIDQYQDMEKRNRLPPNRLPCYTCLHLQPMTEFYNITSNFYYGSQPTYSYNYNRAAQSPPLKVWDRCCIRCNFMKGNYNAGLALTTKGETWMFCGACGHLVRQHEAMGYGGYGTCKPCSNLHNFLKGFGPVIRCMQLVVAIVILPLACTGQAMPWSSTPDSNSLRWIFMVTLVCRISSRRCTVLMLL